MTDVTERDIDVKAEDQAKINRFSRLNEKYQELEEEISAIKEELTTYSNASEELMLCMGADGIRIKIGESFFKVDEDYASEYLETLRGEAEGKLAANSDKCETIKTEMDELKAHLYGKFGSSINLEPK